MITVNEYFGGTVKSLGYQTASGKSTVGVLEPGEYEFGTGQPEIMKVIEGELAALLPSETEFKTFTPGESFEVPGNASFKVKTQTQTAYLCQYR